MSESRRPARAKKPINYSLFADEGDSDGDFADPTPPPSKRIKKDRNKPDRKKDRKPKENLKKDVPSNKMTQRKERKERQPLDEKLFDRDLEAALELSRQESQTSSQSDNDSVPYMGNKQKEVSVIVHSSTGLPETTQNQPQPDPLRTPTDPNDNKENMVDTEAPIPVKSKTSPKTSPNIVNIDEEEEPLTLIETLEGSDVERGGRTRRKAASKAVAKQREMMSEDDEGDADDRDDDEFKADDIGESDSDDDFDAGDADSDFEGFTAKSKKKKGKSPTSRGGDKKTPKAKAGKKEVTIAKAKAPVNTNSAVTSRPKSSVKLPVTPITRRPQPKGPVRGFTPPCISKISCGDKNSQQTSSSSSQSAVRKPNWCSPSPSSNGNNPLGGVRLVSPSNTLRLGLSRHARIKPLHSNVKVP